MAIQNVVIIRFRYENPCQSASLSLSCSLHFHYSKEISTFSVRAQFARTPSDKSNRSPKFFFSITYVRKPRPDQKQKEASDVAIAKRSHQPPPDLLAVVLAPPCRRGSPRCNSNPIAKKGFETQQVATSLGLRTEHPETIFPDPSKKRQRRKQTRKRKCLVWSDRQKPKIYIPPPSTRRRRRPHHTGCPAHLLDFARSTDQ